MSHTLNEHEMTCTLAASEMAPLTTAVLNTGTSTDSEPNMVTTESILCQLPVFANTNTIREHLYTKVSSDIEDVNAVLIFLEN